MGKSSQEKVKYAQQLLHAGIPYREIQEYLKLRFESGMSNTTLQNLQEEYDEIMELKKMLADTTRDLKTYKRMYHELVEKLKDKIPELGEE